MTLAKAEGGGRFIARSIDDTPIEDADDDLQAGYLMPEPEGDTDFDFAGEAADYPEEWQELGPGGLRLKSDKRKFAPQPQLVDADGAIGQEGRHVGSSPVSFVSAWPAAMCRPDRHVRLTSSPACQQKAVALQRPCWCRARCAG